MNIVSILQNNRVLFDGGMGTQLNARGLTAPYPEANLESAFSEVVNIHKDYIAAGANVITTDTFGGNRIKLSKHGAGDKAALYASLGVQAVREAAAGREVLAALDMGPTGELLFPLGTMSAQDCYEAFLEQAQAGAKAGADLAIIETMASLGEAKLAALAAKDAGLDFIISFTYEANGRTLMGDTPECCALTAKALGAKMISANCSGGPEQMLPIIRKYAACCDLPILVEPNAGLPVVCDGVTSFPYTPEAMTPHMRTLLASGADAIGGCCGTTPAHIAAFSQIAYKASPRDAKPLALCSSREYAYLPDVGDFAALPQVDLEEADSYDGDAPALVVNVSVDDPDDALDYLSSLTSIVHTPLIFRCEDKELLRTVCMAYAGAEGVWED